MVIYACRKVLGMFHTPFHLTLVIFCNNYSIKFVKNFLWLL